MVGTTNTKSRKTRLFIFLIFFYRCAILDDSMVYFITKYYPLFVSLLHDGKYDAEE
jgi:hypothetical protein